MKKKKILVSVIYDDDKIEKLPLTSLQIKESVIIEKSIVFFNDPSPCMIHRSAVMKRLFLEMQDNMLEDNEYSLDKTYLDMLDNESIKNVKLK